MTITFQPQFIKQDSAVPLRMIVGGWAIAVAAIIAVGPVANRVIAFMGVTLLAGGLIALSLTATRSWRMLLGASAGALAAWFGYKFAFPDRIIPAADDPLDVLDREHLAAIAIGLSVISIGLGGVLEAVRAQAAPGTSPWPIRVLLLVLGMAITMALCSIFSIATAITVLLTIASGIGLAALTWLRRERPATDYVPHP